MALEHTLEDVYASSAAAERPTGVHRRSVPNEQPSRGSSGWPFRSQAFVAALEHVSDAVLIVDRSGTIRYANCPARALVERPRPEGRHLLELMRVDAHFLRNLLSRLRDTALWRGTAHVEIRGRARELELNVSAVTVSGSSRAHGFSLIVRSVRESRALLVPAAGMGARDVFATMMRLAGVVAHDFNNQIAVVLNYSFILLRELSGERTARAHMEELQQAAWRAAGTARNLLRLTDKRAPEPATLDVNHVIREAHATLSLISRSQTEIEQRLTAEPCFAKARQAELEWLLLDLTQRLRTQLGGLRRVRIATSRALGNSEHPGARVRIHLDAFPASTPRDALQLASGLPSLPLSRPLEPESCESAPKVSAQLGYELALQPLPDDGLRYAIELPGV